MVVLSKVFEIDPSDRGVFEELMNHNRAEGRTPELVSVLNAYLSACQLGITLASLALGWIGEPALARLLEKPLSGFSDTVRHGIAFAT